MSKDCTQRQPLQKNLLGCYKGACSKEFTKYGSGSTLSLPWRSGGSGKLNQQTCCVVEFTDRSLSLVFDTSVTRDEFIETTAWYGRETQGATARRNPGPE